MVAFVGCVVVLDWPLLPPFTRHLDFLLHRHFQSPTAILAMLPYLQRSADSSDGRGSHHASASRLDRVLLSPGPEGGDEEGVSEEERGLAIDPDFPWQTTYKEYVSQTTRRSRGGEGRKMVSVVAHLPACLSAVL